MDIDPTSKLQSGSGEAVLLVEDEPVLRRLVKKILIDLDYAVVDAPDGPRALEILGGSARIELLLTDVVLPGGMTGIELAATVTERRPEIKVLLMSGYPTDALDRARQPSEEIELLAKPFTRVTLARRLREVLEAPDTDQADD
jgi:CheY-like chemotaxis protein